MQMEEIRIGRDGTWYFNGGKMFRLEFVQLLSSHLQLKDEQYFICWMNQEVPVVVEDVPYVITSVQSVGNGGYKASLNDAREVDLPGGEIIFQAETPYCRLFSDSVLDAKFTRAAFWQIHPYLIEREEGRFWL